MLKDKVILVTGPTGGVGSVIAKELDKEGAHMLLFARNREKLESFESGLTPGRHVIFPGDACYVPDVLSAIATIIKHFDRIDGAVLSAGSFPSFDLFAHSLQERAEARDNAIKALYETVFNVGSEAADRFMRQGHGSIFHISTHAVLKPELEHNFIYGGPKAAAHLFINQLDAEFRTLDKKEGEQVIKCPLIARNLVAETVNASSTADWLKTDEAKAKAVQPEKLARWIIDNFDNPNAERDPYFEGVTVKKK